MAEKSLDVSVVKLNKDELVVDLGDRHFVNLVDLQKNIRIQRSTDIESTFDNTLKFMDDHDMGGSIISSLIENNQLICKIPYTSTTRGGRHTKEHRPRRSRRATRRATRRRRV
jgi:hypothetical protein